MSGGRVYLPLTASLLHRAREARGFAELPLRGHAVTPALLEALGDGDQDEHEYAAMTAAAMASIALLGEEDPPRRMVAAVDVPAWEPAGDPADPTVVLVPSPVRWRDLAAVHVDGPDAADDVAAARSGTDDAVDRCLDHDLGWYAVQEVDALLADLGWGTP